MSDYQSIRIKEAINYIARNNYLLPAIQRKFVWEIEQIEMLFDSILRGYPINSFMLWKIQDSSIKQKYKFLYKIYHCRLKTKILCPPPTPHHICLFQTNK